MTAVVAGTGGGTPSSLPSRSAVRRPGLLITYISSLPRSATELVTDAAVRNCSANPAARMSSVDEPASRPDMTAIE
jgi:hypothetical protein